MEHTVTMTDDHAAAMPLLVAADLQDNLLTATGDLERLQTLLGDSLDALQSGFFGTLATVQTLHDTEQLHAAGFDQLQQQLTSAVKALQFQDMATQLLAHTRKRLQNCADRLAQDTFAGDEDGDAVIEAAPLRHNPVSQAEMDTGFVELF